jgi:Zn-dependent M16 (insulinase) family peptidase
MQEGWHYELHDDNLTYNGVVYNEMKGAFSNPDDVLEREIMHSLYPDNCYGFESGGDPKYIPTLSYEQFKEFHKRFYHPANSYIVLYGDLDMEERLEWLDKEYLSGYDYIDPKTDIILQHPFEKPREVINFYPIGENESLKNNTYLSYNVSCSNTLNVLDTFGLNILSDVLFNNTGAPIKESLLKANLGQDIIASYRTDLYQPFFSVIAKGANDKQAKFNQLIESQLKKIYQKGINKKSLTAAVNFLEFKTREGNFQSFPKGLAYAINGLQSWLYSDEHPFDYLDTLDIIEKLKEGIKSGYFEGLIKKYFLDNNHKSYVTLKPSKTFAKEEEARISKELEDYKNNLTEDEKKQIIEDEKSLRLWQETPDSIEALNTLPKLSKEDILEEKIQDYNFKAYHVNDKDFYFSNYHTNGIVYGKYMFKMNDISNEDLPYLSLLAQTLGEVDTNNLSYSRLDNEIRLVSGGISTTLTSYKQKDGSSDIYFVVSFSAINKNVSKVNKLILEMLNNSDFSNQERLKVILQMIKSNMSARILGAGNRFAMFNSLSHIDLDAFIYENTNGISYYHFISNLLENFDKNKDLIVDNLDRLSKKTFISNRLMMHTICEKEDLAQVRNRFKKLDLLLSKDNLSTDSLKFEKAPKKIGFFSQADVNYVAQTGEYEGKSKLGALMVLKNALNMSYLWPVVRMKGGAYGCSSVFDRYNHISFISYRDPNITFTLDAYKDSIDFVKNLDLNEEDLLKLKIGALAEESDAVHCQILGDRALSLKLKAIKFKERVKKREELINATLNDLKKAKKFIEGALKSSNITVIGNEKQILESKDLFDEIIPLNK